MKNGYRLIDGAYCYGNEEAVGEGIKEALDSGIKREDIFVVTKVWATYTSRVELGLEKSLKNLGLDYVDLFLVVCVFSAVTSERLTDDVAISTGLCCAIPKETMTSSPSCPTAAETSSATTATSRSGRTWRSWSARAR